MAKKTKQPKDIADELNSEKTDVLGNSKEILATAEFLESRVIIWDHEEANKVYAEKFFGKWIEEEKTKYLLLSLEEAMLLAERSYIEIVRQGKKLKTKELYSLCTSLDNEFPHKFLVYRDLRSRGFIVKSGFKFGTHFRVYDRGVNPYKGGSKETKEHTKYNVHAVSENHTMSYQEWSRYVRLSQNIRAKALLAVVDEEGSVTYYVILRVRP